MSVIYKVNQRITSEQLAEVFRNSGIRRPVDDLPRLEQMLERADLLVTAWDGDKVIGVARALTDFVYCCYLSDLAVDENYQKQGIGKELTACIQREIGDAVTLILISAEGAMSYYSHIGLEKCERAFFVPRKR
ncbi:ribosomal protein S18 acetylase RimI-like enzyme [Bacillus fengqiuensis]|nr:ribosomal protein S18 acetylase RimI-like enzyme [Bacillus fengqiuensis]